MKIFMKQFAQRIISAKQFEIFIMLVILLNCVLIGVETYIITPTIYLIQHICVYIFVVEILLRFIARDNNKRFFTSGWNLFDLFVVLVSLIPESIFSSAAMVTAIRVLRVFRVLRLLRANEELKIIVSVLLKSLKSLSYNALFYFVFMYLFAIIGVSMFKLPTVHNASTQTINLLNEYKASVPNAPQISPDPYGSLSETMFTLFRIQTGEDWTDLRYNLIMAKKMNLIHVSENVITTYHVIWFIISAFLLLNLVVGSILSNYQIIMDQEKNKKSV